MRRHYMIPNTKVLPNLMYVIGSLEDGCIF